MKELVGWRQQTRYLSLQRVIYTFLTGLQENCSFLHTFLNKCFNTAKEKTNPPMIRVSGGQTHVTSKIAKTLY